ncbi:hypothetical protein [Roseateles sp.]|uniref:hypothetical protein n=1 Tax=Roseateles sp. TaxID=1971397 RepID=UPI0031D1D39A
MSNCAGRVRGIAARSRIGAVVCLASIAGPLVAYAAGPHASTDEDRRAAAALNQDGDRAYREGRFDKALKAYMNSYPNHPNAHAYLMAGDAYWRAVLAANQPPVAETPKDACPLSNTHFASDAQRSLEQHYRPGLALADKDDARNKGVAALYERSRAAAACLTGIQAKYAELPKTSCVDLREVASCIGDPLNP